MRILLTTVTTSLLVACGGGGGSDTSVSPGGGASNDALSESDIKYLAASLNLLKITASSAFLETASSQEGNSVNTETPCPIAGSFVRREPNASKPYSELSDCVIDQSPNLTFSGLGLTVGGYRVSGSVLGVQSQYLVTNGDISGSVGAPGDTISMDVDLAQNTLTAGTGSTFNIERASFRGDQFGAAPVEVYSGVFTSTYSFDGVADVVANTTTPIRWEASAGPTQGALSLSYWASSELRNLNFVFDGGGAISATNANNGNKTSLTWTDPRLQQFLTSTVR